MVTVTYSPNKHLLKLKGHADYGEYGTDIVCASISTIFYNLANFLQRYDKDKAFKVLEMTDNLTSKTGVTMIHAEPASEYEVLIDHDFLYALTGFEMIMHNYPECLNLKVLQK